MVVFENIIKVYIMKSVLKQDMTQIITDLIDKSMCNDAEYLQFHRKNTYKMYSFDGFYPYESDGIYKEGKIYSFRIRTTDEKLIVFLKKQLFNAYNDYVKTLTIETRRIPKKLISKVYTVTPMFLKNDNGYWRKNLSIQEFEERISINLIKKYNTIMDTKVDEDFELFNGISFLNRKPIAVKYKNITLLGDKVEINIADNQLAQDIAYMAIATGIGENNARGAGFINYKYM